MELSDFPVYITGIGAKLGSKRTSFDEDVSNLLKISDEEIFQRRGDDLKRTLKKLKQKCGTNYLYRFSENESLESVSLQVCRIAIENAKISTEDTSFNKRDISGVYSSSAGQTTQDKMPGLARVIGQSLGLSGIDMTCIGLGCVGGLDAVLRARDRLVIDTLENKIGNYLVVVGDATLKSLDIAKKDILLFSEGVCAMVLTNKTPKNGYKIERCSSVVLDGDIYSMRIPSNSKYRMNGEEVFDFAVQKALHEIPKRVGFNRIPKDIYFIPHQGSKAILEQFVLQGDFDKKNFYDDGISSIGNVPGVSTMFGLKDALEKNYIQPGQRVLLGGYGAELKVNGTLLCPVGNPRKIIGM